MVRLLVAWSSQAWDAPQSATPPRSQTRMSVWVCPFGAPDWVCNGDELCFTCSEVEHRVAHADGLADDACATCKLHSVQLNPRTVHPSSRSSAPPRTPNNSWEKGVACDDRPDGTQMPYLDSSGNVIPIKRFAEKRSVYEPLIRRVRSGAPTT